ncbi:hypothetical protein SAMN05216390_1027 [Lachnospiraceae bacterium KH1T2]|nr:hypothetical protein SAMN05216390_1027 [Lachnospiraceae bacterium KH1T2]
MYRVSGTDAFGIEMFEIGVNAQVNGLRLLNSR